MSNVKVPNLTKALLQEAEKEWIYNFSDGYDPKKHRKLFLKAAQEGLEKGLTTFNIKDAFDEKKESNKYYLILADSGMGKTTFMINLYVRYHSK